MRVVPIRTFANCTAKDNMRILKMSHDYSFQVALLLLVGIFPPGGFTKALVYPNRYSFQKTTSSTTEIPMYNHDLLNNSISSSESHSSGSSKGGFRYDIVGLVVGALLLICFLFFIYSRRKRVSESGEGGGGATGTTSCYHFPPNVQKGDGEAAKIISDSEVSDIPKL